MLSGIHHVVTQLLHRHNKENESLDLQLQQAATERLGTVQNLLPRWQYSAGTGQSFFGVCPYNGPIGDSHVSTTNSHVSTTNSLVSTTNYS